MVVTKGKACRAEARLDTTSETAGNKILRTAVNAAINTATGAITKAKLPENPRKLPDIGCGGAAFPFWAQSAPMAWIGRAQVSLSK